MRDFPPKTQESLADYVARVAPTIRGKKQYINDVLDMMRAPSTEAEGVAFAGALPVPAAAPEIDRRLQVEQLGAGAYNRYLIALGQLNYHPAANAIEAYFLRGRTKAAATVALLLIDPERAKAPFEEYRQRNSARGARLAAVGLSEYFSRHGTDRLEERMDAIPVPLLKKSLRLIKPEELRTLVQGYTRRT